MSGDLSQRLHEDRLMRDAAGAIVRADLAHLRASLAARSIPTRVKDRVQDGAIDALDEATDLAAENKGIVATLAVAVTLWLARNPLIEFGERMAERLRS